MGAIELIAVIVGALVSLALPVFFLVLLYYVVRNAVRDGVREAWKELPPKDGPYE